MLELIQRALRLNVPPQHKVRAMHEISDRLIRADVVEVDGYRIVGRPARERGSLMVEVESERRPRLLLEWADGTRLTLEVRE